MLVRHLPDQFIIFIMGPNDETVLMKKDGDWEFPSAYVLSSPRFKPEETPTRAVIRELPRITGITLRVDQVEQLRTYYDSVACQFYHYFVGQADDLAKLRPNSSRVQFLRYPLVRLPFDLDRKLLRGKKISGRTIDFLKAWKTKIGPDLLTEPAHTPCPLLEAAE